MRVLLTGGAGYIGSHTVVELILDGHEVVILDDLSNSKASVIDRIGEITGAAPELIVGDVRDRSLLDGVIGGANYHWTLESSVASAKAWRAVWTASGNRPASA